MTRRHHPIHVQRWHQVPCARRRPLTLIIMCVARARPRRHRRGGCGRQIVRAPWAVVRAVGYLNPAAQPFGRPRWAVGPIRDRDCLPSHAPIHRLTAWEPNIERGAHGNELCALPAPRKSCTVTNAERFETSPSVSRALPGRGGNSPPF